jgi:hypothetical protein
MKIYATRIPTCSLWLGMARKAEVIYIRSELRADTKVKQ